MKLTSLILIAFTVSCFASTLIAQEIPTPDYSARPYILKQDNTLENFERADATSDNKIKIVGGFKMYFTAFGINSTTRFTANTLPRVIIKLDPNIDPTESITLSKAELLKDRRRFLQMSMSMSGAARNTAGVEIKLQFKKIREGVHEIILPTNIEPGEYAFMPMGDQNVSITSVTNIKLSCFGINNADGTIIQKPRPTDPIGAAVYDAEQKKSATGNTNSSTTTTASPPTATSLPVPDFDNQVYYFNALDNSLVDLERAINSKSEGAFGFLNLKSAVSIQGLTSPVGVANYKSGFIVRLANGIDPNTLIELMPCVPNPSKGVRDFNPVTKKDQPAVTTLPLKFKRLEGNTYLITTLQPLTAGEYFFVNKALKEKSIFAFKVVN